MKTKAGLILGGWIAFALAGCATDGKSVSVTTEPAGANCAAGGVKIQTGDGTPTYVCNGLQGDAGGTGASGATGDSGATGATGGTGPAGQSVTVTTEPNGANCADGGVKVQVGGDAPTYVCNGASGAAGATGATGENGNAGAAGATGPAGDSVTVTTEPSGANCADGGVKIQVGDGTPTYVCNGATGATGATGAPGDTGATGTTGSAGQGVTVTPEPNGTNCVDGGVKVQVGDSTPSYVCNGSTGAMGATGDAGATGATGAAGQNVTVTPESIGANCAYGGVKVQVGDATPTFVCNGATGATGATGDPGATGQSATITPEPIGTNCGYGGVKIQIGSGTPTYVCNGATGASGDAGQGVTVTPESSGANCTYGGVKVQVGSGTATYVCNGFLPLTTYKFQSTVTAAISVPAGVKENDTVIFAVTLDPKLATPTNPVDPMLCSPMAVGCTLGAWSISATYTLDYSSGYHLSGTLDVVEVADGGFEDMGGSMQIPGNDRMRFFSGGTNVYEFTQGAGTWMTSPIPSGLNTVLTSTLAACSFNVSMYMGNWGTWGTYHYDYATAQNCTLVSSSMK